MLGIPKIPSKPNELSVSFSSINSVTPQSTPLNIGRHLEGKDSPSWTSEAATAPPPFFFS